MQFTEDLHKNLKQVEASEAPRGYFSLVLRDEARGSRVKISEQGCDPGQSTCQPGL